MQPRWIHIILTISQALLPSALPHGERSLQRHSSQSSSQSKHRRMPAYDPASAPYRNSTKFVVSTDRTTSTSDTYARYQVETVTLTSLNTTQTPTTTNAAQSTPVTTGSIFTTLPTDGNPSVLPFPTVFSWVPVPTLWPTLPLPPFSDVTWTTPIISQTLTLPVSTFQTIITKTVTASTPVPTVVSVTQVSVVNTTVTTRGTTRTTATATSTIIQTTATVLSATTRTVASTVLTTSTTVVSTGTLPSVLPTATGNCIFDIGCDGQDLFEVIDVNSPPANIPRVGNHPVPRLNIEGMTGPIETNKFYSNFFLGDQSAPTFTFPYAMQWSQGGGNAQSWGMGVWQLDESQKVFGPNNPNVTGNPAAYYINPLGIQYMIFSAAELGSGTIMSTNSLDVLSGNMVLSPSDGSASNINFPMVQGMSFVTGVYTALQPELQSSVFFAAVTSVTSPKTGVFKYRVQLEDQSIWLIYASSADGIDPTFKLVSSTLLQGIADWTGSIQVARLPSSDSETLYDSASGAYPIGGNITGYASGSTAQYALSWTKGGLHAKSTTLLMFALPHHVQSFNDATSAQVTTLQLQTTTKGIATAVTADYWVQTENDLPTTMGFAPWRPDSANVTALSRAAVAVIQNVSAQEASQNMTAQCVLNSMYYSGKALSKFAQLVYVMNDLSDQKGLAASALAELKATFEVFVNNKQPYPLYYDTDWKGVVSSASYITGDPGVDFGNSYYNDHHFHYGYFLHAASVIGYLDPTWLDANRDWVNALARDVSNPSTLDTYFPVFRMYDFYHGHSWAAGLFASSDGKNQESSSEDTMFAYGLKMWGRTIGDASMEARGNLMLSVLARSLQNYYLMEDDNKNQPATFIGNKAAGILFENKVDHTTYFGTLYEYIEGIHMLPLLPFSTLSRTKTFVQQEWDVYFGDGSIDPAINVAGGWRGILFANLAIINAPAAWNFFSQTNFDPSWLDGGASLTWYLAWAAGLGGA